jgi:hypothetical protein
MPRAARLTHPKLLLTLVALLVTCPLLVHGPSCGQDAGFHLESWINAANVLRHGQYPHWAITPAWNAGEPRFIFYPPLSWLIGAVLTMVLPITATPIAYIFLSLIAAGLAMHRLASYFAGPSAALIAAAIYVGNPYMLFNAFERSAFAELLAAAWMPVLLLAVVRARPTILGVAVPLALLWLTNAPAAVMGSYMLALLALVRVADQLRSGGREASRATLRLAATYLLGTVLGLALPAYYLVPAATERRFVQVAMAIIPNMRYQDNFLFTHTADDAHNMVNRTASLLALTLMMATVVVLSGVLLRRRAAQRSAPLGSSASPRSFPIAPALALLTAAITFLLVPVSAPVWAHLPELAFLQFPWRLLSVLSVVLALGLALLLDRSTPDRAGRDGRPHMLATAVALLIPLCLTIAGYHMYAQACAPRDRPAAIAGLLVTHHGTEPTDEYTPTDADNDVLRSDDPGYWIAPAGAPDTPAPHTHPTATELNPNIDTDDVVIPIEQTLSAPAPHHVTIHTEGPATLVLNLRDYPAWEVTETNRASTSLDHPGHLQRDDGLIAVPISSAGDHTFNIAWKMLPDQLIGYILSALALLVLAGLIFLPQPRVAGRASDEAVT